MNPRKRPLGIFEEEEEEYRPSKHALFDDDDVEEVVESDGQDPLDAYMATLESAEEPQFGKAVVLEEEDPMEMLLEARKKEEQRREREDAQSSEDDVEYDSDGVPIPQKKCGFVPLIPPVDFSVIHLPPIHKELNTSPTVTVSDAFDGVLIQGESVPKACPAFHEMRFLSTLETNIDKEGYATPTPVQAWTIPAALKGRDVLGIASTGSGKTAAFLLPLLQHVVVNQEDRLIQLREQDPLAVILSPTRELAHQLFIQAKKLSKSLGLRIVPVYGGKSLHEQTRLLRASGDRVPKCDVLICTPGRLIDHLKKENTNLRSVSFLVLDEADRMLQLGFEPQVRTIAGQIRPDRQCLMFSATFQPKVQFLAKLFLHDAVHIQVGQLGTVCADVQQTMVICRTDVDKWTWLKEHVPTLVKEGPVLIFASTRDSCSDLARNINALGIECAAIHGDKHQSERIEIIKQFANGTTKLLCSTDVAARGLDIKELDVVINYEVARDLDSHIHRVGRTGRAGKQGMAYTLLSRQSKPKILPELIQSLEDSKQTVPPEVYELAKGMRSGTHSPHNAISK